ncbi:MAG: phosphoribosylamine--glycine ligase [Defluviitaleaceae bacterium]|nr:phosphoribosylamine--glycine ligase [Defluviitaleaceae bacterium]
MNKVLIVGSGGREHAIAWKLAQSPNVSKIYVAPGNAGMQDVATCVNIDPMDFEGLTEFVKNEGIALTIPGPEAVLNAGIADYFTAEDLLIFGPTKSASIIEGSKSFAKELMQKYNIPTAAYKVFTDYPGAAAYIKTQPPPYVLKADGLAEGKGVIITSSLEEADNALKDMLQNARFGESGKTVVVEEFIDGEEFTYMAFVKGTKVYPMVIAQDHKRAYDNDEGPNTGGMGAYSPVPQISEIYQDTARKDILQKAAEAMVKEGRPFTGILYAGLIATPSGPKVIEFNARFGDPETEVVLPLLESDLYAAITDILANKEPVITWSKDHIIGVVMASKGYPGNYEKGTPIRGLEDISGDTQVFHFATARNEEGYVTNGGRVLFIVRRGETLAAVQDELYKEIKQIKCENLFYRNDIGHKGIAKSVPPMKLILSGKTKDVYENANGTYTLKLKDTATGKDGVFDPGENAVGLSIDGLGRESLKLTKYFFEMLTAAGIPNHYIESDIPAATMTVLPAQKYAVEFICRRKAEGSFLRRYGSFTNRGDELGYLVEATIKDDNLKDPPISEDALAALNIITHEDYAICKNLTQEITKLLTADFAKKGLDLYDIKYEFGKNDGKVILIDELSAGTMRVCKDGKLVPPMELTGLIHCPTT